MSIRAIKTGCLGLAVILIDGGSLAAVALNLNDADKDFMRDPAIVVSTEIKLGKAAEANFKHKQVLDFAAEMINDHREAKDAAFNRRYAKQMAADHRFH